MSFFKHLALHPNTYFGKAFTKKSLGELVLVNLMLIAIAQAMGAISVTIVEGDVSYMVQNSLMEAVMGLTILAGGFVIAATILRPASKKMFDMRDALRVFLSGLSVQNVGAAVVSVLSVGALILSGSFRSMDMSQLSVDNPGGVYALTAQGIGFSGIGVILFLILIVSMVLSLRAQYVGLKVVGKFSPLRAGLTTLMPFFLAIAIGSMRMAK